MRLRPATLADAPRLWAVDQACFAAEIAYTREELNSFLSAPGAFALALETESGDLGGFVLAVPGRRRGHIITLDVLPAWRRCGWARRLVLAAERRLRAAGCQQVGLETAVNNTAALALYARLGYRVQRVLRGYYPGGLDALAMRKSLPGPNAGP